jgi:4-hydroxy-tetrahydrodipicolinate synthase
MSDVIRGLWVAMATPLDAEGAVDHAALVRHGRWLIEHGCDGLVPFGTTGEGPSFSAAERLAATEALLKAGIPAANIALGTGFPAIPDTVALTRQAMALGLTHMLILPPYYFRDATEQGLEDAFAGIVEGVGSNRLRATLYHIPQVSGVAVPPAMLGRLRQRFGAIVAGVKDSGGDFSVFLAFRKAAPDCGCVTGSEDQIARALAAGGTGTICGMANLVPDLVRAMFAGPAGEAAIRAAYQQFAEGAVLPNLKATLAALTGDATWRAMRPPLRPADPAAGARIAATLRGLQARQAA